MKAILIARVSTEEQREMGNSLPAQIARLERYCQTKNFQIIKSFSFDESAYRDRRTEFDQIFNFITAQSEKVAVCCDKVDRLTRNMFDKRIALLYERALKGEIELHFISDGQVVHSNISAAEKFNFGISLSLSKYYSDAVSDNVKRGIEQKARKGELSGRAPYGYKNITIGDKGDIVVDEYAAAIVKQVYELYATGTYSMNTILDKVKEEYGITWSKGYLDWILKHPFYYGGMRWKGKIIPHRYQPIIPQSLFDRVQEVKSSFQKKKHKHAGITFTYRGLFRCADCGLAITPERHKGKFIYYHCTESKGKHNAAWIREEELTAQVTNLFKSLKLSDDLFQRLIDSLTEVHTHKIQFHHQQLDEFVQQQKSIVSMMENMYLDKLKGKITDATYDGLYAKFQSQLSDLDARLRILREVDNDYYITAKYILDLANRAHELFESSEVEEKRNLLNLVLLNPQLDGKKLVYDVRKPFDMIMECNNRQAWCAQ